MNTEIFIMPVLKTHKEQSDFCREKLVELCRKNYGYEVLGEHIGRNAYGKPYFTDNEGLHFNISHTKGMGAIVVDDKPCGVDVERVKEIKLSMAKRFFAPDEVKWIEDVCDERERQKRFFIVWTGKEAYSKMLGCGLTMKMNSYSVLDENIRQLLEYNMVDDYVVCVCRAGT